MIKFEVNNRQYRIEWMDERYEQLYMFYEPQGNLFRYEGQSIKPVPYDYQTFLYRNYVIAPRVSSAIQGLHSRELPIGRYRCSLYGDFHRSGEAIRWIDIFIGIQIEILMYRETMNSRSVRGRINGEFEWLYVESYYRFPNDSIWLTFEETVGERIFLPEMKVGRSGRYQTACILPKGAYERLTVAVPSDIRDCIKIKKY